MMTTPKFKLGDKLEVVTETKYPHMGSDYYNVLRHVIGNKQVFEVIEVFKDGPTYPPYYRVEPPFGLNANYCFLLEDSVALANPLAPSKVYNAKTDSFVDSSKPVISDEQRKLIETRIALRKYLRGGSGN